MSAVFHTLHATGYEFVNTTTLEESRLLSGFDGSSRKEGWKPPHVVRVRVSKRSSCKPAELPNAHEALLLRRSAVDALQDILDAHGELLPVATDDGVEILAFNTRFFIDALDKERSVIERIEGTDIVNIRKYVFIESMIRGIDIFRMPFGPSQNYFSDRFVARVKAAKLKGTDFIKLWSSDESTVPSQ